MAGTTYHNHWYILITYLIFLVRSNVKANPSASQLIPENFDIKIYWNITLFAALVFRTPRTPSLRGSAYS